MLEDYHARKYRAEIRPSVEANLIRDKTAIIGIGQTEFSQDSGRSELQLACEAIKAAADDAGLPIKEIDGIVKYTIGMCDEVSVVSALGIPNLKFHGEVGYGGGGSCATVLSAAAAVATGIANYVVCYRSLNERSGRRYGYIGTDARTALVSTTKDGYHIPFGFIAAGAKIAMFARRYMYETGTTSQQFGWVSVVCREHAQKNPNATFYGKPITLRDHQESPMIADPLRRLDCCLDTDGAVAVIITTAARAKNLKQRPAFILAASQGTAAQGESMTSYYRPQIGRFPEVWYAGQEAFRVAGITPKDIDVVQLYDAFTPEVPMQLEELGFCGLGEGGAFCDGGSRIRVGGELPLNTSGGSLSEAYMHGMNQIAEGVRQIRGTSTNQVEGAELALATAGIGVPTAALILRR